MSFFGALPLFVLRFGVTDVRGAGETGEVIAALMRFLEFGGNGESFSGEDWVDASVGVRSDSFETVRIGVPDRLSLDEFSSIGSECTSASIGLVLLLCDCDDESSGSHASPFTSFSAVLVVPFTPTNR